jgi:hypothetical protein
MYTASSRSMPPLASTASPGIRSLTRSRPAIMNAAFRRENVNAVYLALHAKTLKDLLTCVREIPIHGISVTMPYKEAILAHLDNTDSHTTRSAPATPWSAHRMANSTASTPTPPEWSVRWSAASAPWKTQKSW